MSGERLNKQKAKIADTMARIIRMQLRRMRAGIAKPRTYRLPKEARALKSLLAETQAAGIAVPEGGSQGRSQSRRSAVRRHDRRTPDAGSRIAARNS
jgi:hypothetical protein